MVEEVHKSRLSGPRLPKVYIVLHVLKLLLVSDRGQAGIMRQTFLEQRVVEQDTEDVRALKPGRCDWQKRPDGHLHTGGLNVPAKMVQRFNKDRLFVWIRSLNCQVSRQVNQNAEDQAVENA